MTAVILNNVGLCSSRARWPLAPNFCSWAIRKSYFLHTNHVCWAPQILQFQTSELPSIFLRAQPCNVCHLPFNYLFFLQSLLIISFLLQEHPYLGVPFYQLHPCHTADMMKRALSIDSDRYSMQCCGPLFHREWLFHHCLILQLLF